MTSTSERKMATFQLLSVQGTGHSVTGLDRLNRDGDQDTGIPGSPVSSVLHLSGEPGNCRA